MKDVENLYVVIDKLISVMEKMYYRYKDIMNVEYGSVEYYHLIGELTRLTKYEDDLISEIPKSEELIQTISDNIDILYSNDNIFIDIFVTSRFQSILNNISAFCEKQYIHNDSLIDSQENVISIYDEIYLNFVMRLDRVLKKSRSIENKQKIRYIQLAHIFSFKNLSDNFINNNLRLDSDFVNEFDIKDDSDPLFYGFKKFIVNDLCDNTLSRNIYLSKSYNPSANDIIYLSNILLLKSIVLELSDKEFLSLRNDFLSQLDDLDLDNFVIYNLKKCFDLEYKRRVTKSEKQKFKPIDEKLYNKLVNLIKFEDFFYDKIIDIDNNIGTIASLADYEKDLVSNIDIDVDDVPVIYSKVMNDLSFFVNIGDDLIKKNAIGVRIKNLFDVLKKTDFADGIVGKNYDSIVCNHIVDSIKMFHGNDATINHLLFMYPILTDDLILLDGNHSLIERFSDEITSDSLNSNYNDYIYDKNEQLFKIFLDILDDLERYSDVYLNEWSELLYFKLCEISDIINSVSYEYLCEIKDEVSSIAADDIKRKVLSLL